MSSFFSVGQRNEHWWFLTPEAEAFFSIGMNHIDSATLRYSESGDVWQTRFGNSEQRWIQEGVALDLKTWGFNSIGWTQEVVVRGKTLYRHSRSFTYEEYQWSGMPYCHMLPFAEVHQWDREVAYPDVFSKEFEEWCDFVARKDCVQMANDPNLIGYFYVDCPSWVHAQNNRDHGPNPKGPWFDPAHLDSRSGRKKLFDMAQKYYQVTHDAIRRYDPNHLILGDRYEAKAPLPEEILEAAVPYVDVLSFQYFSRAEEIGPDFERWHGQTGLPVLLADAGPPQRDPAAYEPMIRGLRELSCCVGWHVCGAYLQNRCRNAGFRDERGEVVEPLVSEATKANRATLDWVKKVDQTES
ncbi:MAG: agarase [bacterium]|nr:agarase [bacterium]